jgi:ferredoxin-NADP reductase
MAIPGKSRDMTATETHVSSRRIEWQLAEVRAVQIETPRVKSLLLQPPDWPGHLPGQHVDIRLTAPDGYQAQRSYSIASAPENGSLALTVERVKDGEVSPYLLDELRVGDQLELRGPIGGYFVWTGATSRPLCLIAGGSGVTPLMSMLRHRGRLSDRAPAVLMYSSRSLEDIIYRDELDAMVSRNSDVHVVYALTREQPKDWTGHRGRIDKGFLSANCFPPSRCPTIYVCGPTALVESVSSLLVGLGFDPFDIKTERFGPSGGQVL